MGKTRKSMDWDDYVREDFEAIQEQCRKIGKGVTFGLTWVVLDGRHTTFWGERLADGTPVLADMRDAEGLRAGSWPIPRVQAYLTDLKTAKLWMLPLDATPKGYSRLLTTEMLAYQRISAWTGLPVQNAKELAILKRSRWAPVEVAVTPRGRRVLLSTPGELDVYYEDDDEKSIASVARRVREVRKEILEEASNV
jgi:hypothetical protein